MAVYKLVEFNVKIKLFMKYYQKTILFPRSPHLHKTDSKKKFVNYETFKRKW